MRLRHPVEACSYCPAEATDYFEIPRQAIAAGTMDPDDRIFPVCPRHKVICQVEYKAFEQSCCSCSTPAVTHIVDGDHHKPVCYTHQRLYRDKGYRVVGEPRKEVTVSVEELSAFTGFTAEEIEDLGGLPK